jgi:hypothetical protein
MFVGNNSDKKVPKDRKPIKAIPIHKNKVTRTGLPEFKKKEKAKPKKSDGRCGINSIFLRPIRSAISAETGMKNAKKQYRKQLH